MAQVVLGDGQLSRLHATIFRDGDSVFVADENSLNGTFVNGERVSGEKRLQNGDEIRLGSESFIFVEIAGLSVAETRKGNDPETRRLGEEERKPKVDVVDADSQKPKTKKPLPIIPIIAVSSIFVIVVLAGFGLLLANYFDNSGGKTTKPAQVQQIRTGQEIPIIVIDPLKGEQEDLSDLLALFEETQDDENLKSTDIDDVKADAGAVKTGSKSDPESELIVTRDFWEKQRAIALEPRSPSGEDPEGLNPPSELAERGVPKQKAKLDEMINKQNYHQPMDFSDLAHKRLGGELVEMPMATNTFLLEVGSSSTEDEFSAFEFAKGNFPIDSGSPKQQDLINLAKFFKYDINNGRDRKQMRIRLLRMFHPRARPILLALAQAYYDKYKKPLRVTSLTRSMDYQISLNKVNPNSFKVTGVGSLPPHTSGCAFDLARKHMTADEQNFVMNELAKKEREGVLDALIEYHANACFHVFVYPDGHPTK